MTQGDSQRTVADQREALGYLRATGEILQVISNSPGDVQPVFDAIIRNAVRLGEATFGLLVQCEGRMVEIGSHYNLTPEVQALYRSAFPMLIARDNPTGHAILEGTVVNVADVHSVAGYSEGAKKRALAIGYRAILSVPLLRGGVAVGALTIARPDARAFSDADVALLKTFSEQAVIAIENARLVSALRKEIEAHGRARATIDVLVEDMRGAIVGDSVALREMLAQVAQVAPTDSTVLIQGETGTGKELIARAIHERSARRERALVKVNCAALPRDLVESELFGHEKGAFTGATQQRRGRFELADGGTLFLDEVGDLPLEAQAKLLRVLQEREFERVGGTRSIGVDVRVIAATNRDLQAQVAASAFRSDLFYRLNVFPISVPPLRERREDIPVLLEYFAARAARKLGRRLEGISATFRERATAYEWPGNVRELENITERALILHRGGLLDGGHLLGSTTARTPGGSPQAGNTLQEVEHAHIRRVLEATGGVIEGERGAARVLGLNPSTLRGRLRKLGIKKIT